jgi:hypothetical protein
MIKKKKLSKEEKKFNLDKNKKFITDHSVVPKYKTTVIKKKNKTTVLKKVDQN